MSDLTATTCGCGCERNERTNCMGNNSCIWIILLLLFCGGGCGSSRGGFGCGDDCCCGDECDCENAVEADEADFEG